MELLGLIQQLFVQYGYLVLLLGLPLDAIALPIPPGNTTLTYTGYLIYIGVLEWLPAVLAAYAGSVLGMSITYMLGNKLGMPLIERYGKFLLLKPKHMKKTRAFYEKYGNKMLLFSNFIPGVRQFFGYFAGIAHVPFRTYALYAYTGSALWVLVYIGIGYVFADQWQFAFTLIGRFLKYLLIGGAIILAMFLFLKWRTRFKTHPDKLLRD